MKIEKFIVLLCFASSVHCHRGKYCGICNNHTLCKYSVEGPSSECISYDKGALLANKDIVDIVHRINERRNLVAMGHLNRFPQAANMKKMRWSTKLATFAQRWADQCDRNVKPDREDDCRDLVSMKVGQNIATVLGPAPGLNIKSFVDTWFMLNIHFTASVAYYNQSNDLKTKYFTQLIWAETTLVGCGRAKFFVDELNNIVERLVCNFAPKGNVNGKPIYIIGYPGTQCSNQKNPDIEFPSLCLQITEPATIDKRSSSSLLRILNLTNNLLKQEQDPNNLKLINLNISEINDQRHQKTRHVYLNNTYGAVKRDSVHLQNPLRNMDSYNEPQFTQRQFTQERGHSRMYHGHQSSKEPIFNLDMSHVHTEIDFRRTDYTTPAFFHSSSIQDGRKHYVDGQCTRKMLSHENHNCFSHDPPCNSKKLDCTRGQSHSCLQPNPCHHTTKLCSCNEQTPPTVLPQCDYCNQKCPPTSNCPSFTTTYCPHRRVDGGEAGKPKQFDNYDLFHNLEVKSGEEDSPRNQFWRYKNLHVDKFEKTPYSGREPDPYKQVKSIIDKTQSEIRQLPDSYRSFDYSQRKKRNLEDQTFKPFWQMDEYNQKRPSELKSIRYTTLANKKHRKTRKTDLTTRLPTSTETITIKPKDKSSVHFNNRGRVTEKYLSFDELMHLRKLSTAESIDNDARRRADGLREGETTMDPRKATTITANTPFIRQKHCTRKLTCTWTAAMNGSGGGGGGAGGGYDLGSRTPPGYVDGCTRTSTCTRDYMDRNKIATASESSAGTTLEDEDYCERKSLNIRRRNLDENGETIFNLGYRGAYTVLPVFTVTHGAIISSIDSDVESSSQTDNLECICYEDATRVKRGEISSIEQLLKKDCNGLKGDKKFNDVSCSGDCTTFRNSRSKNSIVLYQCPCNGNKSQQNYRAITLKYCVTFMFYYVFIMKKL